MILMKNDEYFFENIFFEVAIFKASLLREQFRKFLLQEGNFENVFFEEAILIMYFLREKF